LDSWLSELRRFKAKVRSRRYYVVPKTVRLPPAHDVSVNPDEWLRGKSFSFVEFFKRPHRLSRPF